jgi:hypothetical protein
MRFVRKGDLMPDDTTTPTTPIAFAADPDVRFLGTIEDFPRADFHAIPAHDEQRQTELHAAGPIRAGVLAHALDIHRHVDAYIFTDDPEATLAQFAADPIALFKQALAEGDARKANGHSRDGMWDRGTYIPTPETVRLTMWAVRRGSLGATRLYKAFDSLAAVKGHKDEMQSTLAAARVEPASEFLKRASNLAPALHWATAVLCGSVDYKGWPIDLIASDEPPSALDLALRDLLPKLGAVKYFKPAIELLDRLDITGEMIPVLPPSFVAGYLLILLRTPVEGMEFLQRLKEADSGEINGQLMDAFAAVKGIKNHVNDPQRMRRHKPASRMTMILTCLLNSFEGWAGDRNWRTEGFPLKPNSIATFHPALRAEATAYDRGKAKEKADKRAQEAIEKAATKQRQRTGASQLPSPVTYVPTGGGFGRTAAQPGE